MVKVGITGQMGSGKSYISSLFEELGVPVYNSDERARWINNNNPDTIKEIKSNFGNDVYVNGILDSKKMRDIIFKNGGESSLKRINSIVRPYIFKDFIDFCKFNIDSSMILAESALIFESGMNKYLDKIIFVDVPYEIRLNRTITRDGITKEEYDNRMSSQLSTSDKIRLSDFIVDNSKNDSKSDIINAIYHSIVNKK
jgi:dephospho-CoA kinase